MRQDRDMSEPEWLGCEDSTKMFEFLIARARSRRLPLPHRSFRLFACACCRRVWRLLGDERSRAAVEASERFADGLAKRSELDRADRAAATVVKALKDAGKGQKAAYPAANMAMLASTDAIHDVAGGTAAEAEDLAASMAPTPSASARKAARLGESKWQCDLFRDLFGNPFRPASAVEQPWLAWNDGAILKMAQSIYDDRAFDRLPHPRRRPRRRRLHRRRHPRPLPRPGRHVRGCWVVDLLLGKR